MLRDKSVLIVEDNIYIALDLSNAVECVNGRVVGPAGTVAEALALIETNAIAAAVLGIQFPDRDVMPLARTLIQKRVPFVLHADNYIPSALSVLRPGIPILVRPIQPEDVISILAHEVVRFELDHGRNNAD